MAQNNKPAGFSLSAVASGLADRTLMQMAQNALPPDEQVALLEDELRELRYTRHTLGHSEPDDVDSPAHDRWEERYEMYSRHIEEAEVELATLLSASQN